MKPKLIILILVLAILTVGVAVFYNYRSPSSSQNFNNSPTVPTTDIFTSTKFGFQFSIPEGYVAEPQATGGIESNSIVFLKNEATGGTINVWYKNETVPFSLDYIAENYAPTGAREPQQVAVGKNIFYYYGAGGGGVSYPDQYFYNLNGMILAFNFNGPYDENNTPNDLAKLAELHLLSSLQLIN